MRCAFPGFLFLAFATNVLCADGPQPTDAATVIVDRGGSIVSELSQDKKIVALKTRFNLASASENHTLLVNLNAPLDEGNDEHRLGDLDGLASTASVELGYNFSRYFVEDKKGLDLSFSTRVGQEAFKYLDSKNADKDVSVTKTSFSPAIAGSLFFAGSGIFSNGALVGARIKYEKSYKQEVKQQVCTPLQGPALATTCRNTALNAPEELRATIAQLQVALMPVKGLGVSLLASRDLKNAITGLELPLYLISDDKTGLLTGGLKLSWSSDEKHTSAVLFLAHEIGTW